MSVWRRTKANAARRYAKARIAKMWRDLAGSIADQLGAALADAFSGFRRLTLCFDLASPDADRAEVWPWSAYAEPPQ